MAIPETRYARTADGTHVAYQINGDGPIDIVVLRAWHSNLDHDWEDPVLTGVHRRLGAVGRVIRLDRRGTGLSDRFDPAVLPTIEARGDDMRAVLAAPPPPPLPSGGGKGAPPPILGGPLGEGGGRAAPLTGRGPGAPAPG